MKTIVSIKDVQYIADLKKKVDSLIKKVNPKILPGVLIYTYDDNIEVPEEEFSKLSILKHLKREIENCGSCIGVSFGKVKPGVNEDTNNLLYGHAGERIATLDICPGALLCIKKDKYDVNLNYAAEEIVNGITDASRYE